MDFGHCAALKRWYSVANPDSDARSIDTSSKRSLFTDEQRREFAAMVIDDGMSFEEVAAKAGVSIKTARTWVDKERNRRENSSSDTEYVASLLEEHRRLTAELKRLKEEVEFKKKAFAFFAAKLEDQ